MMTSVLVASANGQNTNVLSQSAQMAQSLTNIVLVPAQEAPKPAKKVTNGANTSASVSKRQEFAVGWVAGPDPPSTVSTVSASLILSSNLPALTNCAPRVVSAETLRIAAVRPKTATSTDVKVPRT